MLYFAYGMNTNQEEMNWRCPDAVSMGHARLLDHSFRFSTHADVVKTNGTFVDGVLWRITDKCLAELDALEGFPLYYNRRVKTCWHNGRFVQAMTYYMQPGRIDSRPSQGYVNTIVNGYAAHSVPTDQVLNALELFD